MKRIFSVLLIAALLFSFAIAENDYSSEVEVFDNWNCVKIIDSIDKQVRDRYITTGELVKGTIDNPNNPADEVSIKLMIRDKSNVPSISFELYLNEKRIKEIELKKGEGIPISVNAADTNKGALIIYGIFNVDEERIYFRDDDKSGMSGKVVDRMKENKSIKIAIDSKHNSIYRFIIEDTTGLENAINWLMNK